MQTFLPEPTFRRCAEALDNKRLHKNALEGYQILMVLTSLAPDGSHRTPKGWVNHPAVKMWRGYEFGLVSYIHYMVEEWKERGFNSTLAEKVDFIAETANLVQTPETYRPKWYLDLNTYAPIMRTHRVALLNKNYEHYSQFNWEEDSGTRPDTYEYIWPVS